MTNLNDAEAAAMQAEMYSEQPGSDEFKSGSQLRYEAAEWESVKATRRAFDEAAPARSDGIDVTFGQVLEARPGEGPSGVVLNVTGFSVPYEVGIDFPDHDASTEPVFSTNLAPVPGLVVGNHAYEIEAAEGADLLDLREPDAPELADYVHAAALAAGAGRAAFNRAFDEWPRTRVARGIVERAAAAFPQRAAKALGARDAVTVTRIHRAREARGTVHER